MDYKAEYGNMKPKSLQNIMAYTRSLRTAEGMKMRALQSHTLLCLFAVWVRLVAAVRVSVRLLVLVG